ncbi:hypothetical protein [Kribbella swartbergensis]
MNDHPVDYQTVEAELRRLLDDLHGADPATIRHETDRLRALAAQVEDDRGRERALFRAGQLPRLLAGPATPTSEEFQQAQVLFAEAVGGDGPARARIPRIQQIVEQIVVLADQAPVREAGAIRRLTSPLLRLIDHLRTTVE